MKSSPMQESPASAPPLAGGGGTAAPKISVLIPTFEYARYLPQAIESVLAQDFGDFELVISDDASTDASAEIIRSYAAKDARVRYRIHEKNLGMVANWNWCLGEARGEYVKFVFGDDCLPSPRALGRMAEMLDKEPRAVMAVSARSILDANSNVSGIWDDFKKPGYSSGEEALFQCIQRDRNLIGEPSSVMFRRSAASRGFDTGFRQLVDQEMWFHMLSGGGLVYAAEPLCAFRRHDAQQTVVNRREQVASAESLRIVARYFDLFVASQGVHSKSFVARRRLFRHIYYSRKDCRRTPSIIEAEGKLMKILTLKWYFVCWALHRMTKPLENLLRFFNKPPDEPVSGAFMAVRAKAGAHSGVPPGQG